MTIQILHIFLCQLKENSFRQKLKKQLGFTVGRDIFLNESGKSLGKSICLFNVPVAKHYFLERDWSTSSERRCKSVDGNCVNLDVIFIFRKNFEKDCLTFASGDENRHILETTCKSCF